MAEKKAKPEVLTSVPEWASSTAIAQLLGKSTRRVQQLTQDGVLETAVPPGGGARKYRTCPSIQAYIAHVEERAQAAGDGSRQKELTLKKLEAEVELKESQGALHKLRTAIAEGKYLEASQAGQELAEFLEVFRRFVNAIPTRMAGQLHGTVDAVTVRAMEQDLRQELDGMLHSFVTAATSIPGEGAAQS